MGLVVGAAIGLSVPGASAIDGVVEINQERTLVGGITPGDAAGFPASLTQPGSYRLTGNLEVPSGSDGVTIVADDVTLDLNGFTVRGSNTSSGFGIGKSLAALEGANRVTLRNGNVSGLETAVFLGEQSYAEGLQVRDCGSICVRVGDQSLVVANRIDGGDASFGLVLGNDSAFVRNILVGASPVVELFEAQIGFASGGENRCSASSCTARGERLYYLTVEEVDAQAAPSACFLGFHMASFFEIANFSSVQYFENEFFAESQADAGSGPPALAGWIRTGRPFLAVGQAGSANCGAYSSNSADHQGTVANPARNWAPNGVSSSPWETRTEACNEPQRVWCVQD